MVVWETSSRFNCALGQLICAQLLLRCSFNFQTSFCSLAQQRAKHHPARAGTYSCHSKELPVSPRFPNVSYTQDLGSWFCGFVTELSTELQPKSCISGNARCSLPRLRQLWETSMYRDTPCCLWNAQQGPEREKPAAGQADLLWSTSKGAFRGKGSGLDTKSQLDTKIPSSLVSALTYWKGIDVKVAYNARKETLQSGHWGKITVLCHSVDCCCFPLGFDSCLHLC